MNLPVILKDKLKLVNLTVQYILPLHLDLEFKDILLLNFSPEEKNQMLESKNTMVEEILDHYKNILLLKAKKVYHWNSNKWFPNRFSINNVLNKEEFAWLLSFLIFMIPALKREIIILKWLKPQLKNTNPNPFLSYGHKVEINTN